MTFWGLWYASLALALVSVAIMLLLVVRRMVEMRAQRRRERLRAAASAALLGYMDGEFTAAQVRQAAGGRADIVGDLVYEMREILRGESSRQLIELAVACGGIDQQRRRLRRGNPGARAEAVRRLGIFGSAAVPLLTAALDDRSPGVRSAAAIELTALGAAPRLATLAEAMRIGIDATSEDLRRIFRRAVATEPRSAIALLEDEWTTDALKVLLLDGLGFAGVFEALPAVSAMLQDPAPEVRVEALRALANLGHPSAADVATEALADPDWRVRAQAANCVRRIGAEVAADALENLLGDDQWWVRFRAAEALATFGAGGCARLARVAIHGDRAGHVAQLVLAERRLA